MKGLLGVVAVFFMVLPSYGQICNPQIKQFVPRHNQQKVVVKQHQQLNNNAHRLQVQRQKFLANQNDYGNQFNQFGHGYNNNAVVIQDKIIQFDNFNNVFAVPVTNFGLDYYYRVIIEPERQRVADRVADTVVERLLQRIRAEQAAQPAPAPIPVPVAPPIVRPAPVVPPVEDSELLDKVFTILDTNCSTCHTEGDEKKIVIFDDIGDLAQLTADQKWKIWDSVDGGGLPRDKVMPKNGEPLSDEDVAILREWVRQ